MREGEPPAGDVWIGRVTAGVAAAPASSMSSTAAADVGAIGAWSVAKTKEGRWGMTSVKPAARCQLRVKERMLLTPPMSVRAVRRLVREDLEKRLAGDYNTGNGEFSRETRRTFSSVAVASTLHLRCLSQGCVRKECLGRTVHSGQRSTVRCRYATGGRDHTDPKSSGFSTWLSGDWDCLHSTASSGLGIGTRVAR
jgi:hypothetical protein